MSAQLQAKTRFIEASVSENQSSLKDAIRDAFLGVAADLEKIENRITSVFPSDARELTEISKYLLALGGKRVRPLLALLAAKLCGMKTPSTSLIDTAAGIELIHMATLLHDDIIDESTTRRHKTSAFIKFGLPATLLTGDFLLVRAFGLCARLDQFIIENTERACIELTEGEILEGKITDRPISLENYVTIVGKKTAALFALAAASGAHCAGASEAVVEQLRSFGWHAGVAFQMIDDILDVTADEDLLGKPSGADLRQQTPSLVNVLWLASGDTKAKAFFTSALPNSEMAKRAVQYLKTSPIIDQARTLATEYATKANLALTEIKGPGFDDNVRSHLLALVEYTLSRAL